MSYQAVIEKLPPGLDIDLLLMGKTGHGKSCTGNSILGRTAFRTHDTETCQIGFSRIDGRVIKVVDIPGLCDTDGDDEDVKTDLVVKSISSGLCQFPQGLTALVLVLSYTRFTKEEREAIDTLKKILGDDIINLHTICVITHGDSFKADYGEKADFQKWCRERESPVKSLFEECQFRCVLFDNSTRDLTEKRSQLINLVSIIDNFEVGKKRYTFEKFTAITGSEQEQKLPLKLEGYSRQNGLIKDDLSKIVDGTVEGSHHNISHLKQKIKNLKDDVDENDDEMFNGMKKGVADVWGKINLFEKTMKEEKWSLERKEKERERGGEKGNLLMRKDTPPTHAGMRQDTPPTPAGMRQDTRPTHAGMRQDTPPTHTGMRQDTPPKPARMRQDTPPTHAGMRQDTPPTHAGMRQDTPPKPARMRQDTPPTLAGMRQNAPPTHPGMRGVEALRNDMEKKYKDVMLALKKDLDKADDEFSEALGKTSLAQKLSGFFKGLGKKFAGLF